MFGRDSRKNSSGLFLLSLFLLNGNIETNPGPQHKYDPCGVCSKAVKCNQKRISVTHVKFGIILVVVP